MKEKNLSNQPSSDASPAQTNLIEVFYCKTNKSLETKTTKKIIINNLLCYQFGIRSPTRPTINGSTISTNKNEDFSFLTNSSFSKKKSYTLLRLHVLCKRECNNECTFQCNLNISFFSQLFSSKRFESKTSRETRNSLVERLYTTCSTRRESLGLSSSIYLD